MTLFRGKTLGIAVGLMLCVAWPGWPAGRTGRGQTIVPAESRMSDQAAAFLLGKLLSEDSSRETEAVNWLEKTLLLTPENREARFLLAQTLVRLKRFSAAIPHLEDLLSKAGNGLPGQGPEIESVRTELAGALLAAGDAARARDLLQAPPETSLPPSPRRWEILGDSSMSLADFAGAIAAYRTGLGSCASGTASQDDLSQMASRFERKLALAFLYRGDVRQAEPALSAFHRKHPADREVAVALARLHLRNRRPDAAIAILAPLLENAPQDEELLTEMADAELALGHFARTRALYEAALKQAAGTSGRDLPARWANRLQQMGDFYRATDLLRSLSQAHPDSISLRCSLAWTLASSERYEEAEGVYRDVLASDAANLEALLGLAGMSFLAKDFDAALGWSNKVIAIDSKNIQGRLNRASALTRLGRFDEAVPLIRALIDDPRSDVPVWQHLIRLVRGRSFGEAATLSADILARMRESAAGDVERNFWEHLPRPEFGTRLLASGSVPPTDLLAYGDLFSEVGSASLALALYAKAWKADPALLPAGLNLCLAYGAARKFDEALRLISELDQLYPDHYKLRLTRARILSWNRRFRDSLREYEVLRTREPADPVPAKEMARVCYWAQWPACGSLHYRSFLEPSVDSLLRHDPDMPAATAQNLASPDDVPFRGYERMRDDYALAQSGVASDTRTAVDGVLRRYLPQYRIQKYFFLERWAKDLVRTGHARRALPVFRELIAFAPGNEEARFDESQVFCSLGLTDREEEAYRQLLDIDPYHNLIQRAQRKLAIDRGPELRFAYTGHREQGRGDLADIESRQWQMTGDVELAPRLRLAASHNRWDYSPGIRGGRSRAAGPSFILSGVFNEWARGQAGFTRKQFDGNRAWNGTAPRDRDSFFWNASFSLRDRLDLGIGFDRSDVVVNEFGLRDGTQADTLWLSLDIPFSRRFLVRGRFGNAGYTDGNRARERSWSAGYALTEYPEIFRVLLSGEFRDTERQSKYLYRNGNLENIRYPYWTPSDYWGRGLTLQYWRDVSRLRIARADRSWLDLRYTIGDDSIPNPSGRWEAAWHWEFRDRWSIELRASRHDSRDWDARDFSLLIGRRF